MSTTRSPGLSQQTRVRNVLRGLGLVMTPVGLILIALGLYRFVTVDPNSWGTGSPDGLLMFGGGGFIAVAGFGLLNAGFMGTAARYGAGETMPVVKDSAAYLSDGEGVLGVGRTIDDGPVATGGPFCRSCGVRNDPDARFCDGCGNSLA